MIMIIQSPSERIITKPKISKNNMTFDKDRVDVYWHYM